MTWSSIRRRTSTFAAPNWAARLNRPSLLWALQCSSKSTGKTARPPLRTARRQSVESCAWPLRRRLLTNNRTPVPQGRLSLAQDVSPGSLLTSWAWSFYILGERGQTKFGGTREFFGRHCASALYQGTTLVGPLRLNKRLGFSPCAFFLAR